MPESTQPSDRDSSTFRLPLAVDADTGLNGAIEYRLTSVDDDDDDGLNYFRLSVVAAPSNMSEPEVKLVLVRPLDRETRPGFRFTLTAVDGGRPEPLSSSVSIFVEVCGFKIVVVQF